MRQCTDEHGLELVQVDAAVQVLVDEAAERQEGLVRQADAVLAQPCARGQSSPHGTIHP